MDRGNKFLFRSFLNYVQKEVRKMDEKRKGEIVLAAKKAELRKELAFRDIANVKRKIGNLVREPEMVAIKASAEEVLELTSILLREIFEGQMKKIS